MDKQRIIAHLDLDAFFASVEERENPRLAGWPIVVGSDPLEGGGRGVVSTANYAARAHGIHSAMPISKAWQFSQQAMRRGLPEVVFLTPDFNKYSKASSAVMVIIRKYSNTIQQAGVDEAYIDLSHCGNFKKAIEVCQEIKTKIKSQEKITASIGLGHNKLIAKIASDMQKPDGLTMIGSDEGMASAKIVKEFLEPLSIRKIPGIGPKTEQYLNKLGAYKIKDLKKYSQVELKEMLGKWGTDLFYKIRGIDESPVIEKYEIKSIGEQETFSKDTLDFKIIIEKLEVLCRGVFRSFQKSDFKTFKNVTVTVRFSDFETKNRSHTLAKKEKTLTVLKQEALKLIFPFFNARENLQKKRIRLIGVRLEKLE